VGALPVLLLSALGGCGGKDYSTPGAGVSGTRECRSPALAGEPGAQPTVVPMDRSFSVGPSELPGTAGRVELKVEAVEEVPSITDEFTEEGTFRPPGGHRFVAVSYSLSNRGPDEIEAANSVSDTFGLRNPEGRIWLRVDRADGCSTVSPSLASQRPGLESPELELAPGRSYRTVVVYSLPAAERELAWAGAGRSVALEPAR
jgi:hypothetical protein